MDEIEQAINLLEAIIDLTEAIDTWVEGDVQRLDDLLAAIVDSLTAIDRQVERDAQRLERQSHTIRELARYLSENGVSISRFTTTTQETLVAVALNGDY